MCKNVSELNKENGRYYGYDVQSNQLVEECAELIQAVNRYGENFEQLVEVQNER